MIMCVFSASKHLSITGDSAADISIDTQRAMLASATSGVTADEYSSMHACMHACKCACECTEALTFSKNCSSLDRLVVLFTPALLKSGSSAVFRTQQASALSLQISTDHQYAYQYYHASSVNSYDSCWSSCRVAQRALQVALHGILKGANLAYVHNQPPHHPSWWLCACSHFCIRMGHTQCEGKRLA